MDQALVESKSYTQVENADVIIWVASYIFKDFCRKPRDIHTLTRFMAICYS